MRKSFLLLVVLIITIGGYAQTTYYWVGGLSSASWTTATSWNTALNGSGTSRTTPNYGDTLIFDGSNLGGASPVTGAALINNVKTDTIASLRLQNGANITFINSHAANANLTGNWSRAAAVTGIIVNTTNGSNVFACTNTANVKVGAIITAPSTAVNGGVTYVTSVTPNVSFTTNLPALATATGTSLTVCQPNTWSGDGTVLNVGDIVCTGTQSNLEQIISKVDNSNFFCAGSAQPQQAITSAATLKKVTPLSLTSPTNALYISANSSLTFNNPSTSRPLILFLAPGAKGTVEGLIELDLNTNTFNTGRIYVAPTGGAQLVFKSGSVFKSGELQYPFGAIANDDNNNVVFEAGSQAWYGLAAGTPVNCIFGANYPQSVVKFNKGSLYVHNGGADRFTGYTFREFPNVTSAVDLTLFQPGIVDSVIIPAGLTINHSAGNTIALKGTFVNNGTFGLTNAANGPLLSFIGDGTYTQGLDLKGSGTGVVNYTNTTPASGGSFQRIIVGVDAKLNLQSNTNVQTYGQTTVFGTLNFGNAVINNVATSGTALSLRPTTTVPTVTTIYSVTKSNTLVLDSVTNFQQGMLISGTGIPANTYIVTSSQAGKIVWLSNPVTVPAGTTVTASVNPSSATIITSNTGGLASSYTITGTSVYGLPTGSIGINYRFEGATTTPFPSTSLVTARNLTLAANVTSNVTDLRVSNTLELNSNILTVPAGDTVRVLSGNPISGASASKYIVLQSNATTGERGFLRIGNMNTATLFPVGTASSYLPVTVTPAGANEDYSVNTFTGVTEDAMPNGTPVNATEKAKMVDAVWHINNNFTPTGTTALQLEWPSALEGSNFTNFSNSQIGIALYNSGWGLANGSGNNNTNIANANYNNFGPFRISEVVGNNTTWDGATWSNGAPTSSVDAIIANSTAPSNFTCKALTINSGVELTTTGITVTVNGDINNNGNGIGGTGTLTIASTAALTGSPFSFNGTLIVNAGATLSTNGKITLSSNNNFTGRIGNSLGVINGNITVQRYIPSKSTRRFSFITSPVSQALSAAWQQQVHITGAGTGGTACPTLTAHSNGFDATTTNAPSMFSYDASQASGSRWVANTTGTTGFTLTPGTGYRLNIRGPRATGCSLLDGTTTTTSAVTLSATGAISNAQKNMGSFSNTYNNNVAGNWVLIGNPYPSELDFTAFRTDAANGNANQSAIANAYIIYDPANAPDAATPANMYSTWNAGTWSNAPTSISNANGQYIANGQAFFVQANAASNLTLNFAEAYKANVAQNGVFRQRSWNDIIRIGLNKENVNIDNTVIRYANDNNISNTALTDLDATLLSTSNSYLGTLKAGKTTSIQTRQLQTLTTDTLALDFNVAASGVYSFNFSEHDNFSATNIYLLDKHTNTTQEVKANPTYSFTIDKNNAATQTNRFALVFSKEIPVTAITGVKVYPNPADKQITVQLPSTSDKYTVSMTDVTGKRVYQSQLESGVQSINVAKFTAGNYILEITDAKGNRTTEKLVKQ